MTEPQLSADEARAILDNHVHEFKWFPLSAGWLDWSRFHCTICGVSHGSAIGGLTAKLIRNTRCEKPGCTDRVRYRAEACIGAGGSDGRGVWEETLVCGLHGKPPWTLGWSLRNIREWSAREEATAHLALVSPLPVRQEGDE